MAACYPWMSFSLWFPVISLARKTECWIQTGLFCLWWCLYFLLNVCPLPLLSFNKIEISSSQLFIPVLFLFCFYCYYLIIRVSTSCHASFLVSSTYILNKILTRHAKLDVSCLRRLGLDFPLKPTNKYTIVKEVISMRLFSFEIRMLKLKLISLYVLRKLTFD